MNLELPRSMLAIGAFASCSMVWSHGHDEKTDHGSMPGHQAMSSEKAFGRPAAPKNATRSIAIGMSDVLRFSPTEISVKKGETVRFVVKNSGKTMHEMVLGTMEDLKEHAQMMQKHPGMEHHEPNMAHVAPGRTRNLIWQFTRAGEFYYGCLVPGHLEAGMVGKIIVSDQEAPAGSAEKHHH